MTNFTPHRRSLRLPEYDYTQGGAYFITLCTHERASLFGDVVHAEMHPSRYGQCALAEWMRTPDVRREVTLDVFQVMPNHLHAIILLTKVDSGAATDNPVGATGDRRESLWDRSPGATHRDPYQDRSFRPPQNQTHGREPACRSLGAMIAGYKAAVTSRINALRGTSGRPVWQRNFYEHVIRGEAELTRVREYVVLNPVRWDLDPENPAGSKPKR